MAKRGKRLAGLSAEVAEKLSELIKLKTSYLRKPNHRRLRKFLSLTYGLVEEFEDRDRISDLFELGEPYGLPPIRKKATAYHSLLNIEVTKVPVDKLRYRRRVSRWATALIHARDQRTASDAILDLLEETGIKKLVQARTNGKFDRKRRAVEKKRPTKPSRSTNKKLSSPSGTKKAVGVPGAGSAGGFNWRKRVVVIGKANKNGS